ncbi:MAG: UDP-N-acetylmuramoyl-L-alanyl-D-glutamate--2,6-diaminopimelate ligase [Dactylosporangium sp.]|nr:UDP-N-acetylmuramoyl-L-alanyl-D-glutamate--2,6-diaminopimelate ligase [Dactylosporangium sp.]NNJ62971.1 UDP-N-acetylmuramoyl-L-alanyl-D-glutamate--2,6-diaminopimelate ligase [Dactylosporangium sp.]
MSGYPRPRNLPSVPLPQVAALLGAPVPPPIEVTGITHASGEVRPGDCYAGLPGARYHGAQFAEAARAAGAVALLTDAAGATLAAGSGLPAIVVPDPRAALGPAADRIYGEPTRRLRVIGITGTAGKTSTAYLIAAGLRAAGERPGLVGTIETRLGDLVIASARTTPEATDLHALLAVALEHGIRTIVLEVSSHALVLGRVGGVRFAVGGFTNFGTDHLDFHADLDEYFEAKARLFDGRCATEIVNLADPSGARLVRPGTQTYTPPGGPDADWYATDIILSGYTQRFTANGPGGIRVPAGVGLPGAHNVANALLAIASLTAVGVEPAVAGAAVATCPAATGRMERVDSPTGIIGIVDYAHKPDSIKDVLDALRMMAGDGDAPLAAPPPGRRIICVLGAGGDRDRGKRSLMGAYAAGGADTVIVTDDNPRTEDPARIRADVLGAAASVVGVTTTEIPDRRSAIAHAVAIAVPGDVIALLGKGHEQGQEIAGVIHPFDDRVELAQALATKEGRT